MMFVWFNSPDFHSQYSNNMLKRNHALVELLNQPCLAMIIEIQGSMIQFLMCKSSSPLVPSYI